ncbi:restriction endonuclease subunit S [Pareuzebyella sediminis]|uniref:restriction endonuclease subunit S n=1 Tax=Pareuzebyella sediminis TaxID=2607998 RepID=UPI0011F076D9|nr:restriction endonuclease subunit S [Pareuzebyella sediminis]
MNTETPHINNNVIASEERTKQSLLVPQLRFAEFDDLWSELKYGEVFSFYSTNSLSRDTLNYEDGKVKNIHYGDIHTKFETMFNITNEEVPFINEDIDLSRIKEECYCKEGDLLIADASEDYSDIGKTIELVNLNNEKLLAGLHTFLARPNKYEVSTGFPGYLVQSWKVRKQVMTIAQGTKVLGLATSRLAKIKIDLPTLPEQQKIASFLSSVDTKLQQLTQKKELLEQYKKGVMQQLFSQQIRFKQKDGSNYPDWEEKRIGDVLIERDIKNPKSEEYPLMAFMANKGVAPKGDRYNREFLVSDGDNKKYKQTEYGDFIYSSNNLETGSIGLNRYGNASISPVYSIFKIGESCEIEFMSNYLVRKKFINKMIRFRQGVIYGQWRIHESEFLKIVDKIPCKEEQQKIAHYLSALDTKIESVAQQITQTQLFKKGLLQQMFV